MRTLLLGLDAFDPATFERLYNQGKLRHLARYVEMNSYARFGIANPAQSEVSWTSIATGLNPGGHGLFDFVHRDPATYSLHVSLLPTKRGLGGTQFTPPFTAHTIFDQAVAEGFPATSLWWPATFPARLESPVRTIPGLGTPDIQGKLGVGTLFTTETADSVRLGKTPHEPLRALGKDRFEGQLHGPKQQTRGGEQQVAVGFQIGRADENSARLHLGSSVIDLRVGEWSPIFQVTFKLGMLLTIQTLTRVIVTQLRPHLRLYFLPLQLHPLHSPWHYATPGGFVKETWQAGGPFLTLGWPQDTTGLEDGCMTDEQFVALCESIDSTREQILMHHLKAFREGLMGVVFDTLDRVQHMFWRDRQDIVEDWYVKLDGLVSRVESQLNAVPAKEAARFLVVSDHGFGRFDYKVHLNRWLLEHGYLAATTNDSAGNFQDVNWSQTQAYSIGLNSIYLNLAGREGGGIVSAGDKERLANQICGELVEWTSADGRQVVRQAWTRDQVFDGKLSDYAPDLVIGFAPGYRASQENGLGRWLAQSVEPNHDHWGADHCIDPTTVPGVLFANKGLAEFSNPTYRDVPALAIDAAPDPTRTALPEQYSQEDQNIVEERLRSLGYL